jgi:8-oxo-dGTP pyrophosphatase MutT (NUDIX family)
MITNNILYAAGILFYSRSMDGTPYFLLGKNIENKWEGFGGGCEVSDKQDSETTAAREAWEETLGSIGDVDYLKSLIRHRNTYVINSKTTTGKQYNLYLVKIAFNLNYREKFLSTKKFISKIDVDKKFLEINDIRWVSIQTIQNSIFDKNNNLIKLRNVFEYTFKLNYEYILNAVNCKHGRF